MEIISCKSFLLKSAASLLSVFLSLNLSAGEPLWLRHCSISPDGRQVVFSYRGDLYKVSAAGGRAVRLTSGEGCESDPVWSPDSRTIAFTDDCRGNKDICTLPVSGGLPERVTFHSSDEIPLAFSPDGERIWYSARLQDPVSSVHYPARWMPEVYSISLAQGRPVQEAAFPLSSLDWAPDGRSSICTDIPGKEEYWRKHHQSAGVRNLMLVTRQGCRYITEGPGENREAVYLPDGRVAFLSERDGGSFNVWCGWPDALDKAVPLTTFTGQPVRFLSVSDAGKLCFSWKGRIWTMTPGHKAEQLKVSLPGHCRRGPEQETVPLDGYEEVRFADKGIFFVSRGDVFYRTFGDDTCRQLTCTPSEEAGLSLSPDGTSLVYASERGGGEEPFQWDLYVLSPEDDGDWMTADLREKRLFPADGTDRTVPAYSPDGKSLAYIENRSQLKVFSLENREILELTDGSGQVRRDPQTFFYSWSPDSRRIVMEERTPGRDPYTDIVIVEADGSGRRTMVTETGYVETAPQWVMDGKAILYLTDRYGLRSHSAYWVQQKDVCITFLDKELRRNFSSSGEGMTLRLTPSSADLGSAVLSTDGSRLYFTAEMMGHRDLWRLDTGTGKAEVIRKDVPSGISAASDSCLWLEGREPVLFNPSDGRGKAYGLSHVWKTDPSGERTWLFHHLFCQIGQQFYDTSFHGIDLQALKAEYAPYLAHISDKRDFSEFFGEILGELNSSHCGAGVLYEVPAAEETPELGLLLDMSYEGPGLRVAEVPEGSPLDFPSSGIAPGTTIEKIGGQPVLAGKDFYRLLNGRTGQTVSLALHDPESGRRWEVETELISRHAMERILYRRWTAAMEKMVDSLSDGRLGYVHLEAMEEEPYRALYADVFGRFLDRDGIVIDTRFNGGGRLHEDLDILFSGKPYLEQVIRGRTACTMPSIRWNRPSVMLVCTSNYSNAHGTPWVYRHNGLGKLVGSPVPGSMTSAIWEKMLDPELFYMIPIAGYRTLGEDPQASGHVAGPFTGQLEQPRYLEGWQLEPDVRVPEDPLEMSAGRDRQLEAAVRTLLEDIVRNGD